MKTVKSHIERGDTCGGACETCGLRFGVLRERGRMKRKMENRKEVENREEVGEQPQLRAEQRCGAINKRFDI